MQLVWDNSETVLDLFYCYAISCRTPICRVLKRTKQQNKTLHTNLVCFSNLHPGSAGWWLYDLCMSMPCVCVQVLVVGGGDGGVVREIAKHSCVQEIHLCEIDQVRGNNIMAGCKVSLCACVFIV